MFELTNEVWFAVHGGADSAGGMAGLVAGVLGFIESLLALSPAQFFQRLLPGIAGLDNLHPLFVHFPIALLALFFLLDFAGSLAEKPQWRQAAGWFLYAGSFFAVLTVAAGLMAAASVAHGGDVHEIMENHEHLAIAVLILALALSVWRWAAKTLITGAANTLYLILAALMNGLLLFATDLGGLMVYGYGVAVAPVSEMNREAAELHQHGAANGAQAELDGHGSHEHHH